MHNFVIRELKLENLLQELTTIEFDKSYASQMTDKFKYKNYKIYGLNAAQANILKQTALSVGADCATPKNTITGKIENADCILGGSISQLQKISSKLKMQPFALKRLGFEIEQLAFYNKHNSTKIMGILNITPDSFSDGGNYLMFDDSVKQLNTMIEEGTDIIDIGAESTKPYSSPVPEDVQLERLIPILEYINMNNIQVPISIDTRSAKVAQKCLEAGAKIINDVSGLMYDENMVNVISKFNCNVVIQHSKGTPDVMQDNPIYENLMDEIFVDLKKKTDFAISNGVNPSNIIIDPGIGFGKTRENNFEILRRFSELKPLGYPILLGLSRKSMLNLKDEDNLTKDIYTLALNTLAIENKVDIIRVHNVKLHKRLINMLQVDMG